MIDAKKNTKSSSKKKKDDNIRDDAKVLKTVGKTGLITAGALGVGAGIEAGRSVKDLMDIKDDIAGIKNLRKNKAIREIVKDQVVKHVPHPYSDQIIDKVRWTEKNFPKINKIDKYSRPYGLWNNASKKVSRTALDNADRYAQMATDELTKRVGPEKLNETELKHVKRIPYAVRKAAKSITHWKNARALRKGAAVIGGLSGAAYINGRMIEH